MNISVTLKRIESLKEFNPEEFCMEPIFWNMQRGYFMKAFVEAKKLAEKEDGICLAIAHTDLGEFALADSIGYPMRFILFNAEQTTKEEGEVRGVIYNSGGVIIYEQYFRYAPGKVS